MKKVILLGLNHLKNYGDKFILQDLKYIVEQMGAETEIVDVNTTNIIRKGIYYSIILFSKLFSKSIIRHKLEFCAVSVRNRKYYNKNLNEVSALIFGFGSFKYGTQKLWAYYGVAIEEAQKLGIPVMINGVNIQKCNKDDYRCQLLKKCVNYPCVKMISSRDGMKGVRRLEKDYLTSNRIICKGVGDIAFWIPECYNITKNETANIVGINLISGNIFERYGYHFSEQELLDCYCDILKRLDEKHISWKLFTNGLPADYKFGLKLLKKYKKKCVMQIPNSAEELLRIISGCRMVMGARLHACICAYALDIPIIGLIWDEKLLSFSELVGIREYFYDERQICSKKISNNIMNIMQEPYQYDTELRDKLKMNAKNAIEIFLENEVG